MNLSKLFEMQKVLDEKIELEKPPQPGEDRLAKRILALQVELGELANEWRGFKFWSKDQRPRTLGTRKCQMCDGKGHITITSLPPNQQTIHVCSLCKSGGGELYNPLLEEYVDCLHFILGIGNTRAFHGIHLRVSDYKSWVLSAGDVVKQFNYIFNKLGDFSEYPSIGNYGSYFDAFIGLGEMLGFTWEQIEQAYISKNEMNHSRQANGY